MTNHNWARLNRKGFFFFFCLFSTFVFFLFFCIVFRIACFAFSVGKRNFQSRILCFLLYFKKWTHSKDSKHSPDTKSPDYHVWGIIDRFITCHWLQSALSEPLIKSIWPPGPLAACFFLASHKCVVWENLGISTLPWPGSCWGSGPRRTQNPFIAVIHLEDVPADPERLQLTDAHFH